MSNFLKNACAAAQNFWFKSVRRQLVLGIALVHAVLMSVFVFDMVHRQRDFLSDESFSRAVGLARTLAASSLSWVLAHDYVGLGEIILTTRSFPGLKYAMVCDPRGRVLAHTDKQMVGLYLSDPLSLSMFNSEPDLRRLVVNALLIDVAVPVMAGNKPAAWVRVCLDQSDQRAGLERVALSGIVYTVLAILLGTLLAVFIAKRLTAGLVGLMRVSERVQNGERDVLADESRGDEIGVLGRDMNRMLTAIRGNEKELRRSLDLNYTILNTSAAAIIFVDAKHVIRESNAVFAELFGLDPASVCGSGEWIVHPSQAAYAEFKRLARNQLGNPKGADIERRLKRENGQLIWCRLAGRAVDPYNLELGVIWLIIDISKRKLAEEALRFSEERFRSISDFTFDWEYWQAPDGSLLWVSPSCERVTGYTPEDFMRNDELFLDIVYEPDAELVRGHMREVAGNPGLAPCNFDYRIKTRNNVLVWVNHCCRAIHSLQDEYLGRRGCMRDVTLAKRSESELISAKERAEAANQAKDNFLATLSHEVRTPLNGILGMLQLVRESGLEPEKDKLIGIALESSRKLLSILSDILDLAKVQSGRVVICTETFSPARLIDAVGEIFRDELFKKNLHLTCTVDESVPKFVSTDELRLRQVLFNLVGNAVKFTRVGGIKLEVCALPVPPGPGRVILLFCVEDSGIGIEPEKLAYVFESFTQADVSSFARRYGGLGLGLALVKRFVELMGGSVCVDSTLGEGSKFYFTIEAEVQSFKEAAPALASTQENLDLALGLGGLEILLAEDDPVNQITAKLMLEKLGHHPAVAKNGQEVLNLLEKYEFDLVLMDIQMPDMDGLEATKLIRALPGRAASIPIIAVTAHDMQGDREYFLNQGMDGFLAKPFLKSELAAAIALVRDKRRPLKTALKP